MFSRLFGGGDKKDKKGKGKKEKIVKVDGIPDPELAYEHLVADPAQFMRRNHIEISGDLGVESGASSWLMVSEGYKPGRKGHRQRRSSDGSHLVEVPTYQIMSAEAFEKGKKFTRIKADAKAHPFDAQHIRMEKMPGGVREDLTRKHETSAAINNNQPQTYITSAVTGCSIVRMDSHLHHMQPSAGKADTFGTGFALEESIGQFKPNADVFGMHTYNPTRSKPKLNLFIQTSRRGSVYIHGQRDEYNDKQEWAPTPVFHRFPSPQSQPLQSAASQPLQSAASQPLQSAANQLTTATSTSGAKKKFPPITDL